MATKPTKSKFPNSRLGWHKYYVNRYNRYGHPDAAYLAMVYLFLHLAFEEPEACTKEPSSPAAAPNADAEKDLELASA